MMLGPLFVAQKTKTLADDVSDQGFQTANYEIFSLLELPSDLVVPEILGIEFWSAAGVSLQLTCLLRDVEGFHPVHILSIRRQKALKGFDDLLIIDTHREQHGMQNCMVSRRRWKADNRTKIDSGRNDAAFGVWFARQNLLLVTMQF